MPRSPQGRPRGGSRPSRLVEHAGLLAWSSEARRPATERVAPPALALAHRHGRRPAAELVALPVLGVGAGRARARQLRDEDGLSFREICDVLAAEGIRPKRSDRWHPETVRRMLANATTRPPTLRKRSRP
ncbi:recombinase family protein [Streptomyces sp. NPDC017964]|uniref:recombinase family protein n=1 Tax=Streptomyces sp. NPDC017964 TaxID=3365022 RepID=UPI0037ABEFFF